MVNKGKLIVFEGIDGSGKSTLCKGVFKYLDSKGIACISTFEPTNGRWGKLLRKSFSGQRLNPKEELELFIRDREEHVKDIIIPSMLEGKTVLCDRYYLSTIAYQGARGIDINTIKEKNEEFAPLPDVAFILQIDVNKALKRISEKRGDRPNSFEEYEYLKRVSEIFDSLDMPCIKRLDASLPKEVLLKEVVNIIDNLDC